MPTPVSRTRELDAVAARPQRDLDLAVERELEGVREKIQHDLLPHVAVDVDRLGERLAIDDELETGALDGRAEHARELRGHGGEIGRLVARLDAPGLDAREVEQRVDELEQAQAVAVGERQRPTTVGRQRPIGVCEQVLERAEHQRERRAELVADVREERRLGAVDLGERGRASALCLERLRVGKPGRDLRRDEAEERAIRVIESAHRAHASDENRRAADPGPAAARAAPSLYGGAPPRARRQHGEPRREIFACGRSSGAHDLVEPPKVVGTAERDARGAAAETPASIPTAASSSAVAPSSAMR